MGFYCKLCGLTHAQHCPAEARLKESIKSLSPAKDLLEGFLVTCSCGSTNVYAEHEHGYDECCTVRFVCGDCGEERFA